MESISGASDIERLNAVLDLSWEVFFNRLIYGRVRINKESSMQLHYSSVINQMGDLFCLKPNETFSIELEHSYKNKNIDITCSLGEARAAIELKCFRKKSNRATDLDMYDVLKDIQRLISYDEFQIKKFICIADDPYYSSDVHSGHSASVSIRNGMTYAANTPITPSWVGRWKDKSRDNSIIFDRDVTFNWKRVEQWYLLKLDS
jgi:hypothetical protein